MLDDAPKPRPKKSKPELKYGEDGQPVAPEGYHIEFKPRSGAILVEDKS